MRATRWAAAVMLLALLTGAGPVGAQPWPGFPEGWRRHLDAPGQAGVIARAIEGAISDPRAMTDCAAGLCGRGLSPARCALAWAASAGCRHDFGDRRSPAPQDDTGVRFVVSPAGSRWEW